MPETTNLNLPTFNPDDKPSWLVSWNGAMNTIDQAIGRIDGDIAETGASIEAAQTAADAAKTAADAAQAATTALQGQVDEAKTAIQDQAARIDTLSDATQNIIPLKDIIIGKRIYGHAYSARNKVFTKKQAKVTAFIQGYFDGRSLPVVLYAFNLRFTYDYDSLITNQADIHDAGVKLFLGGVFKGNVFNCFYSQVTTGVNRLYFIDAMPNKNITARQTQGICYLYLSDLDVTLICYFNTTTAENSYYVKDFCTFIENYCYLSIPTTSINLTIEGETEAVVENITPFF